MTQARVVLHGVHRSYVTGPPWRRRRHDVLRGLELELGPGEALALRGDNGCGKTTLLRLVAGLLLPDAGRVEVCGAAPHRSAAARAGVGFSGDDRGLFRRLTGRHNLEFFAALHGFSQRRAAARIDELTEELDLADALDCRIDRCSSGMAARLSLARALLHAPRVLLLDEPTKSLDERHRNTVHGALTRRTRGGSILILATHSAEDARRLGARTALLADGILHGDHSADRDLPARDPLERALP